MSIKIRISPCNKVTNDAAKQYCSAFIYLSVYLFIFIWGVFMAWCIHKPKRKTTGREFSPFIKQALESHLLLGIFEHNC